MAAKTLYLTDPNKKRLPVKLSIGQTLIKRKLPLGHFIERSPIKRSLQLEPSIECSLTKRDLLLGHSIERSLIKRRLHLVLTLPEIEGQGFCHFKNIIPVTSMMYA